MLCSGSKCMRCIQRWIVCGSGFRRRKKSRSEEGGRWLGGAMYSPEEGDMKQDGGKGLGEKEGGGGLGVCGPE